MKWVKISAGFVAIFAVIIYVLGWENILILTLNQFEITEFEVQGEMLYMNGEINSQTLDQFEAIIAVNPQIMTLVEGVVPGSMDDDTMIALAYRVRELGLNTYLTSESEIYSGGVDLFLAGVDRSMESGAIIGVHSWADGSKEAKDYPRDAIEHEQNRRYIEEMLGDDAFYWFTIYAAPADDIYVMNAKEIQEYGLIGPATE